MKAQRDSNNKVQVPAINKKIKDSKNSGFDLQKEMDELRKMEPDHYVTTLKRRNGGIIGIEMLLPKKNNSEKDTSKLGGLYQMMSSLNGGIVLRGAVYEKGDIQSFYLRNDQKNLIALFFQLPSKPVKIGDSWQISTNLISMDQNFKCDSAYKRNTVSVTAIDDIDTDRIVTVKYDIEEYITGDFGFAGKMFGSGKEGEKMFMKMTHKATAKFSVKKGRWISYDGELITNNSGGLMGGYSRKTFSLIAL
ncbi:MAG: hypothetical protein V4520_20630 [Bacteroidota bacterium]